MNIKKKFDFFIIIHTSRIASIVVIVDDRFLIVEENDYSLNHRRVRVDQH
jgi:hypothetical protein